jgi:hypothetical protein
LQAGCQRWNDDEFNLKTLNKPLKTKANINPASVKSGAVDFTEGYFRVGTWWGSYADVTFVAADLSLRRKRVKSITIRAMEGLTSHCQKNCQKLIVKGTVRHVTETA